jgi:hypothetical protein
MGKISGKPGPDPLAIRDEDQEDDDFLRWLGPKTTVYEITNRVKLTEFDSDGHSQMAAMIVPLQELGFTVTRELVPLDYDVKEDTNRRYRRFTYRRVSKDDVLLALGRQPGETADEYATILFSHRKFGVGERRVLQGDELRVANMKFRVHISALKREEKVKVRYGDDGRARYYLPEHRTDLGVTPGGQNREVPPPGVLLEDNVTAAADNFRRFIIGLGAGAKADLERLETGTWTEGELIGAEPTFARDTVKYLYKLLTGTATKLPR